MFKRLIVVCAWSLAKFQPVRFNGEYLGKSPRKWLISGLVD